MLAAVNEILLAKGLMLKAGSAVDATLTDAPSATKKPGTRDPEMKQTQKWLQVILRDEEPTLASMQNQTWSTQ